MNLPWGIFVVNAYLRAHLSCYLVLFILHICSFTFGFFANLSLQCDSKVENLLPYDMLFFENPDPAFSKSAGHFTVSFQTESMLQWWWNLGIPCAIWQGVEKKINNYRYAVIFDGSMRQLCKKNMRTNFNS